jgi:predicted metal-binding membrane protein
MMRTSALEQTLRHDRLIVAIGIATVVAFSWGYLLAGAGIDMSMADMPMDPEPWSPAQALLMFAMWWVMMVAMMAPSAAPTVLLYATIRRRQATADSPVVSAWLFLAGYLVVWACFSVVAVAVQWGLDQTGLLSGMMATTSTMLAGIILLAAGLYQLTPIKRACLRYCQSPLFFLSRYWQPGAIGALRMGFRHGSYCVGCCWFLMALLFVVGVMNLVWIAAVAIYVGVEKMVARSAWLSRTVGAGLIVAGGIVLARGLAVPDSAAVVVRQLV